MVNKKGSPQTTDCLRLVKEKQTKPSGFCSLFGGDNMTALSAGQVAKRGLVRIGRSVQYDRHRFSRRHGA